MSLAATRILAPELDALITGYCPVIHFVTVRYLHLVADLLKLRLPR